MSVDNISNLNGPRLRKFHQEVAASSTPGCGAVIRLTLANELPPLGKAPRRLGIIGGIGVVLGYALDDPTSGERL